MDPVFLTLDEVLEMHAAQIDLYGGTQRLSTITKGREALHA